MTPRWSTIISARWSLKKEGDTETLRCVLFVWNSGGSVCGSLERRHKLENPVPAPHACLWGRGTMCLGAACSAGWVCGVWRRVRKGTKENLTRLLMYMKVGLPCDGLRLNSSLSSSCASLPWPALEIQGQRTKQPHLFFQRKRGLGKSALTAVLCAWWMKGFLHVSFKTLFSLDAEDLYINFGL